MNVFKFGGASIKDAQGVKNLKKVLEVSAKKDLVIVISAMGKNTNALEQVVQAHMAKDANVSSLISEIYAYHHQILEELFSNSSHRVYKELTQWFSQLKSFLDTNKSSNHAFVYDQVVGFGELVSTTIVSHYLQEQGIHNLWLDVRKCIHTDNYYRDANVAWDTTQASIIKEVPQKGITITQGFLGAEHTHNFTTTLGREGSDYTAAIFAYCLNAKSVTIWKDVPGVLNADPRFFEKTQLLHHISYREAIELAFYGASVIHPKTLQPLQRKEIPLYVKSFLQPENPGTCVGKGALLDPMVSCFILKRNQVLISLSSLDFSFIMEDNISKIFSLLHQYQMRVELIQNSAISFSVCVDDKYHHLEALLIKLKETFKVECYKDVTLYTVRHSKPQETTSLTQNKQILLKQERDETVQLVVIEG